MSQDVFCCPICLLEFDANGSEPMVSGCGHTICRLCVLRIGHPYRCPICRVTSQSLNKNFALLDMIVFYHKQSQSAQQLIEAKTRDANMMQSKKNDGVVPSEVPRQNILCSYNQAPTEHADVSTNYQTIVCEQKTYAPGYTSIVMIYFQIRASIRGCIPDVSEIEVYVNINQVPSTCSKIVRVQKSYHATFFECLRFLCHLQNASNIALILRLKDVQNVQIEESSLHVGQV